MLAAVQPYEYLGAIASFRRHKVTEVPDLILGANNVVPVLGESAVVFCNVGERPSIDPQNARITKMRVCCEINHPAQMELDARMSTRSEEFNPQF
jgi:hypothetical protein